MFMRFPNLSLKQVCYPRRWSQYLIKKLCPKMAFWQLRYLSTKAK